MYTHAQMDNDAFRYWKQNRLYYLSSYLQHIIIVYIHMQNVYENQYSAYSLLCSIMYITDKNWEKTISS